MILLYYLKFCIKLFNLIYLLDKDKINKTSAQHMIILLFYFNIKFYYSTFQIKENEKTKIF